MKLRLPSYIIDEYGTEEIVIIDAKNIKILFSKLSLDYPKIASLIFDNEGHMKRGVICAIDDQHINNSLLNNVEFNETTEVRFVFQIAGG
jgi:hypothetical protein